MIDAKRFSELVDRVESNLKSIIVESSDKLTRQRALRAYEDTCELFEMIAGALGADDSDLAKRINEGLPIV
jgi:hypothetical protein